MFVSGLEYNDNVSGTREKSVGMTPCNLGCNSKLQTEYSVGHYYYLHIVFRQSSGCRDNKAWQNCHCGVSHVRFRHRNSRRQTGLEPNGGLSTAWYLSPEPPCPCGRLSLDLVFSPPAADFSLLTHGGGKPASTVGNGLRAMYIYKSRGTQIRKTLYLCTKTYK